jgi:hypothetical protein
MPDELTTALVNVHDSANEGLVAMQQLHIPLRRQAVPSTAGGPRSNFGARAPLDSLNS